jgi:hypothetical protein
MRAVIFCYCKMEILKINKREGQVAVGNLLF